MLYKRFLILRFLGGELLEREKKGKLGHFRQKQHEKSVTLKRDITSVVNQLISRDLQIQN